MNDLIAKIQSLLGVNENDTKVAEFTRQAVAKVAKKRHPFGYTETEKNTVISRYEDNIIDIAIYLYNKQGAEGQTSHSENDVSRGYESAGIPKSYLYDITPLCRVR